MILYHATTENRGQQILRDGFLSINAERYYTRERSGNGFTTPGYVYFSNEITFPIYFANCHNLKEKSQTLYLFRMEISDDEVEADEDELRCQSISEEEIQEYGGRLEFSLLELKSCRVRTNIYLREHEGHYSVIEINDDINEIVANAGYDLEYVKANYNETQMNFINNIAWVQY